MNVTVLIPAWNDTGELAGTLDSLRRAVDARAPTPIAGIEIVVAAGGAEGQYEQAQRAAAAFTAGPCTVIPQRPLGKMRALRDAMEAVSSRPARFLLLLDADTRLEPTGLAEAMSFLDAHPELAGVGGVIQGGASGVGAAHDVVNLACQVQAKGLRAVTGWAILLRGSVVWPNWEAIFAEHDYPLHIDYQVCERIFALTGLSFAVWPAFGLQTPRARGWAFLRAERRHHRAMFARASIRASRRYIAGAAVTVAAPAMAPIAASLAVIPFFWPAALPLAFLSVRRLRYFKDRYDRARNIDPTVERVSFSAFVRDEWVFSLSALLGAADCLRGHVDGPSFRGYRNHP